jgi:hypothetical protein
MGDEADVGLVDAHAEGDGRDQTSPSVLRKRILVARRIAGVQPGMIGQRVDAPARSSQAAVSSTLARAQAIDDAASPADARP